MMLEASDNGVLGSNELKKWCKNNYLRILNWFDCLLQYESLQAVKKGEIQVVRSKGILYRTKYVVDSSIYEEAKKLKGLKNFLIQFSKIDDSAVADVAIYEEYLMMAQMLGIADKVSKDFKTLYPNIIIDYSYYDVNFVHDVSYSGMLDASRFFQE